MAGGETRTTEREGFTGNQKQTPHGKKYVHVHVYRLYLYICMYIYMYMYV